MNLIKEEKPITCQFCSKYCENNSVATDNEIKTKLEFVFENRNTPVNEEIICKSCTETLENCYNFKLSSIRTENYMKNAFSLDIVDVNLMDVSLDKSEANVCRFCLKLVENCVSLSDVPSSKMILSRYFSELDSHITGDPKICISCKTSLENYICFVNSFTISKQNSSIPCDVYGSDITIKTEGPRVLEYAAKIEMKYESNSADLNVIKDCIKKEDVSNEFKCEYGGDAEMEIFHIKNEVLDIKTEENIDSYQHGRATTGKKASLAKPKATVYRCELCSFRSMHKRALRRHHIVHKSESEVTMHHCDTCGFKTKYKGVLERHRVIHQTDWEATMYQCEICDYVTKHKEGMRKHSVVHRDESDITIYHCEFCEFRTRHEDSLKMHKMLHQDESELTIYQCDMCEFKTKYRSSLKKHKGVHHDETTVPTFQCEICKFEAKRKCDVEKHLIIHCNDSNFFK